MSDDIIAIITDSRMERPMYVICDSALGAHRAVAAYLESTAPVLVSTGKRLDHKPAGTDVIDWVIDTLEDVEDIEFDWVRADTADQHQTWCYANKEALRRTHAPQVETIKVTDGRL